MMTNSTQPLPDDNSQTPARDTHPFWATLSRPLPFPRATQMGVAASGGALAVVGASLAMNWIVSRVPAPRRFPVAPKAARPVQMTAQEYANEQAKNGETNATSESNASAQIVGTTQTPLVLVEGANADGSGLKDFPDATPDDLRRFQARREEDRLLRERRALEDQKKRIERELEGKQLEEKRRQEDAQTEQARRDEDRKRIEDRLGEDRRLMEERTRGGDQLAATP